MVLLLINMSVRQHFFSDQNSGEQRYKRAIRQAIWGAFKRKYIVIYYALQT